MILDVSDDFICSWSDGTLGKTWTGNIQVGENTLLSYTIDNDGCSLTKDILIETECGIFFPNSFTPNDDNQDDAWSPINLGVDIQVLKIFNRWGEIVYESQDNNVNWIAKENPMGVYSFYCLYIENNINKSATGNITLVR